MLTRDRNRDEPGQALVELALVLPLFAMVVFGIITIGIGIFYQQQITNAAREGARYASVHSATALCPTVSHREPDPPPMGYFRCDPPPWSSLTNHARGLLFGLNPEQAHFSACWSGYWTKDGAGAWSDYDAPPVGPSAAPVPTYFRPCTIGGVDPRNSSDDLSCPPPATTITDDMSSSLAVSSGTSTNQVTVYACYRWHPPLAGFLILPEVVTLRAVVTEAMEYQQ
jgi:hypothetical protein